MDTESPGISIAGRFYVLERQVAMMKMVATLQGGKGETGFDVPGAEAPG
jgi:hypothetical protein